MSQRKDIKILLENWNRFINEETGEDNSKFVYDFINKHFNFEAGTDVDTLEAVKKEIVKAVMAKKQINVPEENILITVNLARSKGFDKAGPGSTADIIKGTSGKLPAGEKIAAAHPDASEYVIFDNANHNLSAITKGIVNTKASSNAKIKSLEAQLEGETSPAAIDKIKSQIKLAREALQDSLNIKGMHVDEEGNATEVHGASASRTASVVKDPTLGWRKLRNTFFKGVMKGSGILNVGGKNEAFIEAIKKFPLTAELYNDIKLNQTVDMSFKKGDPVPDAEIERPDDHVSFESAETPSDKWKVIKKTQAEMFRAINALRQLKDKKGNPMYTFSDSLFDEQPAAEGGEEASTPKAEESKPKVIRIYDFDDTLAQSEESLELPVGVLNFFMSMLNPGHKQTLVKYLSIKQKITGIGSKLKKEMSSGAVDPKNVYIVSNINSAGMDKKAPYIYDLLSKGDPNLKILLKLLKVPENEVREVITKASSSSDTDVTALRNRKAGMAREKGVDDGEDDFETDPSAEEPLAEPEGDDGDGEEEYDPGYDDEPFYESKQQKIQRIKESVAGRRFVIKSKQ